jgi:carbon storage regulator
MLVIRRRVGESILIGDDIELQITDISANRVKIGIVAPRAVPILRKEIQAAAEQNVAASSSLTTETVAELLTRFRH